MRYTEKRGHECTHTVTGQLHKQVRILLFLLLVVFLTPGVSGAENYFYIQRPKLAFNLSFEYDKNIIIKSSEKGENSTSMFREGVEISTKGWVYHPALVVYSFTYTPQWEQSYGNSFSDSDSFFHGFSAGMTFLQFKRYTLKLNAERSSSRIRSRFSQTTRVNSESYGAILSLKYRVLPTFFSYTHQESEQKGFYETDTVSNRFNFSTYHRFWRSTTSLSAYYLDTNQEINRQDVDNEIKNINVQNKISILKNNNLHLESAFTYEESFSTNNDDEIYNVRETLSWKHRPNLRTRYSFQYEMRDRFDKRVFALIPREIKTFAFNLNHSLYENLVTNINAGYDDLKIGGNREEQYGVGIDWGYRRRIPNGTLGLFIGQSYRNVNVLKSEDFSRVTDETHVITDVTDAFLVNAEVDTNSIDITDNLGNPLLEGIHYILTETGGFTGIRCKSGILDCVAGVQILVDYRYRSSFPFDYSAWNQSYGIQLNLWSFLELRYRYAKYEQKFLQGTRPDELSKNIVHSAGAGVEWKITDTSVEFEDIDSATGLSLRRIRFMESVVFKTEEEIFFNIVASYAINEFKKTDETTKVGNIFASAEKLVFNSGKVKAEAFMRNVRGDDQDQTDIGFSAFLNWIYNIYDIDLTYMFTNEKNSITDQTFRNHYVFLNVRRNLF